MRVTPKVELVTFTPNPEETVALGAKLCYSDADISDLKAGIETREQGRFIRKLAEFGHLSPIEHASFTFGIEGVSRSFLAQVTRHRIASFSVKSQRYAGANTKDGSFNYIVPQAVERLGEQAVEKYTEQMKTIQGWYDEWVEAMGGAGEASFEDARFVLPNGAETKMIMTMNARELQHFFNLRCCNRAQWEIREVAWQMLDLVRAVAPNLFEKSGPACLYGACPEGKMSCGKAAQVKEYNRHRRSMNDTKQ